MDQEWAKMTENSQDFGLVRSDKLEAFFFFSVVVVSNGGGLKELERLCCRVCGSESKSTLQFSVELRSQQRRPLVCSVAGGTEFLAVLGLRTLCFCWSLWPSATGCSDLAMGTSQRLSQNTVQYFRACRGHL